MPNNIFASAAFVSMISVPFAITVIRYGATSSNVAVHFVCKSIPIGTQYLVFGLCLHCRLVKVTRSAISSQLFSLCCSVVPMVQAKVNLSSIMYAMNTLCRTVGPVWVIFDDPNTLFTQKGEQRIR